MGHLRTLDSDCPTYHKDEDSTCLTAASSGQEAIADATAHHMASTTSVDSQFKPSKKLSSNSLAWQAMQERAKLRAARKSELEERKKRKADEEKAKLQAQEDEQRKQEKEEKEKKLKEAREKKRLEKQVQQSINVLKRLKCLQYFILKCFLYCN